MVGVCVNRIGTVLLRMERAGLQRRQFELVLPLAQSALVHSHRERPYHLFAHVQTPLAYHLVDVRVRSFDDQRLQLGFLLFSQKWRPAGAAAGLQPIDPRVVGPEPPVAQRLTLHTALFRRLSPRGAVQDRCQRQQSTNLCAIATLAGQRTKPFGRVVPLCDRQCRAPRVLPDAICSLGQRIEVAADSQFTKESTSRRAGITAR